MISRILALDYGEKRIGMAISDPLGYSAQPLAFLANDQDLWPNLQKILTEYEVKKILLGLPINLKGQDTQKTQEVRDFAVKLEQNTGLEVVFCDERFSSKAAERFLITADVSRKKRKKVIDSQAAAFFLQGYLQVN
jgi:putative holliday junction resolvase